MKKYSILFLACLSLQFLETYTMTYKTPLHKAVKKSNTHKVHDLIAQGANVNAQDSLGNTPLHYAVAADTQLHNAQTNSSSLYLASTVSFIKNRLGDTQEKTITQLLLEADAHVLLQNKQSKTALQLARQANNLKIVRLLTDHLNIQLHYAAQDGDVKYIETLIANGATVDNRDRDNQTPLHKACIHYNEASILKLIKAQANTNSTFKYFYYHKNLSEEISYTPLQWAAFEGRKAVVEALLLTDADPHRKTRRGETILDLAYKGQNARALDLKEAAWGNDHTQIITLLRTYFAQKRATALLKYMKKSKPTTLSSSIHITDLPNDLLTVITTQAAQPAKKPGIIARISNALKYHL
ncbi:ankyrin repeat domain-containing protein [Candidatus Dependentiae bacterium]|nr:ankyrin repeat domain-containing protein [Candidatus Dependentiae bacterium]